jgi:hypothetical protein
MYYCDSHGKLLLQIPNVAAETYTRGVSIQWSLCRRVLAKDIIYREMKLLCLSADHLLAGLVDLVDLAADAALATLLMMGGKSGHDK